MEDYRIEQVAQKIYDLTRAKRLTWDIPKRAKNDYFVTIVGNNEIAIFSTGLRYVLEISDLRGNLLGSMFEDAFIGTTMFYSLKELYDIAKKEALKIDENLDNLLNNLNNL